MLAYPAIPRKNYIQKCLGSRKCKTTCDLHVNILGVNQAKTFQNRTLHNNTLEFLERGCVYCKIHKVLETGPKSRIVFSVCYGSFRAKLIMQISIQDGMSEAKGRFEGSSLLTFLLPQVDSTITSAPYKLMRSVPLKQSLPHQH